MIKNDRQYAVSLAQAKRLRDGIAKAEKATGARAKSKLDSAGIWRTQLKKIEDELLEYDRIKAGIAGPLSGSIEELGRILIRARLARGWTQEELAQKIGLPKQSIQDYEAREYERTSLSRLQLIMQTLGLTGSCSLELLKLPELSEFSRATKVART